MRGDEFCWNFIRLKRNFNDENFLKKRDFEVWFWIFYNFYMKKEGFERWFRGKNAKILEKTVLTLISVEGVPKVMGKKRWRGVWNLIFVNKKHPLLLCPSIKLHRFLWEKSAFILQGKVKIFIIWSLLDEDHENVISRNEQNFKVRFGSAFLMGKFWVILSLKTQKPEEKKTKKLTKIEK